MLSNADFFDTVYVQVHRRRQRSTIVLWRCGGVVYDIDGIYNLLAATVRRAQWDAQRGDKAAKRWVKCFLAGVKC